MEVAKEIGEEGIDVAKDVAKAVKTVGEKGVDIAKDTIETTVEVSKDIGTKTLETGKGKYCKFVNFIMYVH